MPAVVPTCKLVWSHQHRLFRLFRRVYNRGEPWGKVMTSAGDKNPFGQVARYSEIGFIIPASVLLGYVLGRVADHFLHQHWLYIVGLIFGGIIGFVQMIRMALAFTREKDD